MVQATHSATLPEVTDLMNLSKPSLMGLWQQLFSCPAPKSIQAYLLRQIIGWQLQVIAHGGLSALEKRQLISDPSTRTQLAVGSRLIRVWQDETHQVTVLEDGFLYKDRKWKSLSSIARTITGMSWSGPVFFGLKK